MLLAIIIILALAAASFTLCVWLAVRWLRWQRTLLALAAVFLLVGLFYGEEDWRGRHAWSQYQRQWEAKGDNFDPASMVPPPVPDDQNFAMTPVLVSAWDRSLAQNGHALETGNSNFLDLLTTHWAGVDGGLTHPTGDWRRGIATDFNGLQKCYRTLAAGSNLFPVPARPGLPANDVLLALSPFTPAIEELRQAASRPYSRFPVNYATENPCETLLPHVSLLQGLQVVLQLRASAELQAGQSDHALADAKVLLRLAGSIHDEPILGSQLV